MTRKLKLLALVVPALMLAGCEFGTKVVEQVGPRGTGLAQVAQKRNLPTVAQVPAPPYELTPDMLEGPRARDTYQNVQVLGDISADEFNYTMAALTEWVSPADGTVENGGCNYCHNPENMASDELYTKVVARKMLQMTRAINATWTPHFSNSNYAGKGAGVTCWTCHRGQPVPVANWTESVPTPPTIWGNKNGQNTPARSVAFASLPYDPFSALLQGKNEIRVQGPRTFPTGHEASIQKTEQTYGLMMHMSQGLGVNCTYCHNSQNFANWSHSRVQRVNAWYGIRMVRDVNDNYITALGNTWPANRVGPNGDPRKVNCTTCHRGISKPLGGVPMLKDYPALKGPVAGPVPALPAEAVPIAAAAAATPVAAADTTKPAA
ncbi:photosynthetic reaction center cytochrome PufC [Polymorphobacter fuscus]|uniref:Photosynthetic reaction center cytochrome c subunit n=1 Tax=Sandarakinorhabdus fusca TaxID=1439888 RepID=A0A7C9KP21_9SPHN|nr:photosynthetic reaction center cytochrome PufC [Polymorphobacter fuscus]KAB7644900.1 photosynthetic reaction center cytochrome c subunit [Polymorphobacter fuscus]MQT18184.1 photosynthetic reaction center cytochrome c subunit [Polymorphobacter fuscus]NJC09504.1 photosynthetic reaction center cytochrome c subunit [Polymorphobacter fuscus]